MANPSDATTLLLVFLWGSIPLWIPVFLLARLIDTVNGHAAPFLNSAPLWHVSPSGELTVVPAVHDTISTYLRLALPFYVAGAVISFLTASTTAALLLTYLL